MPLELIVFVWLKTLLFHVFPVTLLETRLTLAPEQNVVGPLALIVGAFGIGFTVTKIGAELDEQPFASVIVTK